jgi:hypothetical protein
MKSRSLEKYIKVHQARRIGFASEGRCLAVLTCSQLWLFKPRLCAGYMRKTMAARLKAVGQGVQGSFGEQNTF